jgi:HK97 family phage major capsid protein
MNEKELRAEMKNLDEKSQAILKEGRGEGGTLDAEQSAEWDAIHDRVCEISRTLEIGRKQAEQKASLDEIEARFVPPEEPRTDARTPAEERAHHLAVSRAWALGSHGTEEQQLLAREYSATPSKVFRFGDTMAAKRMQHDLRTMDPREFRDQGVGVDADGGVLVPQGFMNELEKARLFFGSMLQNARIVRTATGNPLPWPSVNDTTVKGAILAENVADATVDLTFAEQVFGAFKYTSQLVNVSIELMQDSAFNMEAEVGALLGERLGRIHNEHLTTGAGTTEPEGAVTGSTLGKLSGVAGGLSFTYEELIDLELSVDRAYRQLGAQFVFNDTTFGVIRKIFDTEERPIWQPSVAVGAPSTLMGYGYQINNDMAVPAIDAIPVLFGAIGTHYVVRDVLDVTLRRLDERFADQHQVAFVAINRMDGQVLNAGGSNNPIKHLVMAAA